MIAFSQGETKQLLRSILPFEQALKAERPRP
jgi:hypothetical protein